MTDAIVFVNGAFAVQDDDAKTDTLPKLSMVVEGSKITHIGHSNDQIILEKKSAAARIVDLDNRLVIPGFIDSHTHILFFGLSLSKPDLSFCTSLNEIRHEITKYASSYPELSRIVCKGWHQPATGGKALASMIDDLDPRPIFIEALDLHSTWCNTAALNELPLGKFQHMLAKDIECDAHGKPSGLLAEAAQVGIIWPHLNMIAKTEEKQKAIKDAVSHYTESGYTGVIDMAMDSNAWEALAYYRERNDLPLHIAAHWLIPYEEDTEAVLRHIDEAISMHQRWHPRLSPEFCVVGIKLILDGVIDGCTAALSYPYGTNPSVVEPIWPTNTLELAIKKSAEAGLQIAIHALGDVAISRSITALSHVQGLSPGRHRIEHLELATEEDAKRLGDLGITASIQPVHSDPALLELHAKLLRPESLGRLFPYRDFIDANANVALGTDAPTACHHALSNLYHATTRRSIKTPSEHEPFNPKFALTLAQATAAATQGAAYSRFAEKWVGELKAGYQADFVVMDGSWTPDSLLDVKVMETWSRGRKVYDSAQ
ncbi:hypothetical protein NW762_011040 [Fusarium torreyae]|uniref:Amidohydrolase 3 domain-containing protein n=1 Tax=Fusarium torreyae TaxID=1237075 RepID=A0A9W8RU76_9HYPO|nr:hypothetical protein NW762_011040 [Fusarium torreyae]